MAGIEENLADLCFLCLQVPELENYLDLTTIYDEDDNLTYAECFTICTQIDLSANDNLPHNLCKSCGLELQMSYDFHKKVEESKHFLQQYQQKVRADEYELDERTAKYSEIEESASQQSEPQLRASSRYGVTDQIDHQVAGSFLEADDSVLENFKGEDQEHHFVAITKQEEGAAMVDVESLVGVDDGEERLTQIDDCLVLEEHLAIDEFNNVETLDEEADTETLHLKSSGNSIQIYKIGTNDKYFYEAVEDNANSQPAIAEKRPRHTNQDKKDSRSWQENVVAVANKEHLPLEAEHDDNSDFEYEVMQTATDDDVTDVVYQEKDNESAEGRSRKRHVGTYSCDVCLKVYPNYSRMMAHSRCHTADRPKYPCIFCNRIYATKQAMECHIQTVHEKTGFTCTICNKVFAIRRSLEVHMRFHNGEFPYACNLCERKFAQLCHLNTHKNVKHNNVRFGCDYPNCGKFFTSSTSLRNHEYIHGIMPFECEYCQRGYPAKAKLKVHIKRKHGKDLTLDELENMRKFHVMRSKVNLVQVVPFEQEA